MYNKALYLNLSFYSLNLFSATKLFLEDPYLIK